jgi:hypothetical protein
MIRLACYMLVFIGSVSLSIAQPVIKFDNTTQHLGFVHKGDTLRFQFIFTNTGNKPLVISDAKVECGCTIVEKPDYQIDPGKKGEIKVMFNTAPTIDRQDRTVIVVSNASNSPNVLRFKCVVLKQKK